MDGGHGGQEKIRKMSEMTGILSWLWARSAGSLEDRTRDGGKDGEGANWGWSREFGHIGGG